MSSSRKIGAGGGWATGIVMAQGPLVQGVSRRPGFDATIATGTVRRCDEREVETEHGMRLLRHSRGKPETEYVEAYPTAPPLDSTLPRPLYSLNTVRIPRDCVPEISIKRLPTPFFGEEVELRYRSVDD
jgi:hypothetical protein